MVGAVHHRHRLAAGGVTVGFALLHQLFQGVGNPLVAQLPAVAAGQGNHGIPVTDGGQMAGVLVNGLAELPGKVRQISHGGVFFENHFAVFLCIDFQGVTVTDNMDIENLVLLMGGRLDNTARYDIFDAGLKIYGFLLGGGLQNGIHVGLELDFQMVFIDLDVVDDQFQIITFQMVFVQNILKDFQGRPGGPVDLDDGVSLVGQQFDLVADAFNLLLQVGFQLVVGLFQQRLLVWVFHQIPDALALGDLQLFLELGQH